MSTGLASGCPIRFATALAASHATSVTVEAAARTAQDAGERVDNALDAQRLAPWRASPPLLAAAAAVEAADAERLAAAAEGLNLVQISFILFDLFFFFP